MDGADRLTVRPDFTVLIYPAYLTLKDDNDKVAPELMISSNTPPVFMAMTMDDSVRVETALFYALALKKLKVPVELHIYPKGGHGYGLRKTGNTVDSWPNRLEDWLRAQDYLR